ncbi:MAG: NADH-quinone oxidoreductase subunit J [Methanomassiliicoccales archaeon]|nr:NADH-quinone oxidoreductase subunit J [Methanomassiliicoccales archaeon]
MDLTTLFFLIFAGATVGCAVMVVASKDIVHSVVYLAATFVGVGILYMFLSAEYLFLIQILVYVGAINVLILFGIMLTKRRMVGDEVMDEICESESTGRVRP